MKDIKPYVLDDSLNIPEKYLRMSIEELRKEKEIELEKERKKKGQLQNA